jgi:hypothetical protein
MLVCVRCLLLSSVVCRPHKNRQISLGHLGTSAIRKHNESVEIVDKLASLCLKSLGKAHERRKYGV